MDINGIPWQNLSPLLKDKLLVSYIRSLRTLPLWATVTVSELHLYKNPTKISGAKGLRDYQRCAKVHYVIPWNSCHQNASDDPKPQKLLHGLQVTSHPPTKYPPSRPNFAHWSVQESFTWIKDMPLCLVLDFQSIYNSTTSDLKYVV